MSVPLPAACELMNLIGRSGQFWAWPAWRARSSISRKQQPSNDPDHFILPPSMRVCMSARFIPRVYCGARETDSQRPRAACSAHGYCGRRQICRDSSQP